jgi:plasmid stabilization system protein ParE
MKYRISRRADADIERICKHIAKRNPETADRLDETIHRTIQSLAEFPGMGHRRSDVDDNRYLFWSVGNYVVAYRMEPNVLLVVRVVHEPGTFASSSAASEQRSHFHR